MARVITSRPAFFVWPMLIDVFSLIRTRVEQEDLGAKLGANSHSPRATPGHGQLTFTQLDRLLSDAWLHAAMLRRCLRKQRVVDSNPADYFGEAGVTKNGYRCRIRAANDSSMSACIAAWKSARRSSREGVAPWSTRQVPWRGTPGAAAPAIRGRRLSCPRPGRYSSRGARRRVPGSVRRPCPRWGRTPS